MALLSPSSGSGCARRLGSMLVRASHAARSVLLARVSLASVSLASVLLAACASLLDIPEDPRLEPSAAAPALEPQQDATARPPVEAPAAPPEVTAPSPTSEVDGSGASVIAEQMRPSPPAATGVAGAGPDAGASEPVPEPLPPEPLPPEPPLGTGGATGQEPPPEPSVCGNERSQGPNGRCFALISTPLPWSEARDSCRALGQGWDLAVARTAELNAFLATLITDEGWLGGTDQNTEQVWRWVDDSSVFWQGDEAGAAPEGAFANWNPTEPNGGGNSDCLRLVARVGNEWADLECELPRSALCEGPLPEPSDQ